MIFDMTDVQSRMNKKIKGVVHVGAYVGEEIQRYRNLGLMNTIFFEPQKDIYDILSPKIGYGESAHNIALGSAESKIDMHVSRTNGGIRCGSGASSSMLAPKVHLSEHPHVTFPHKITVDMTTLDLFFGRCSEVVGFDGSAYSAASYNFLNVDVQGYELEVLKGADEFLQHTDGMILEVNRDEVYEGCPLIKDIDEFLQRYGMSRIMTTWQSTSWGDALYVRN